MLRLFFILTIPFLAGCRKPGCGNMVSDYLIYIHYVDSSGNNVYPVTDQQGKKGWNADSARLYFFVNGIYSPVFPPAADSSNRAIGIQPWSHGDSTGLAVLTDLGPIFNDSATYIIHLRTGVLNDTIACRFYGHGVTDIWYNSVHVLDLQQIHRFGRLFTIVK